MKKVLVTGAAGLLGTEVVKQLKTSGVEVHALVRSIPKDSSGGVCYYPVDLSDDLSLDQLNLPTDLDCIFHLAQAREFRDFPKSAQKIFDINVSSTVKLLAFAQNNGISNFVYASSGGVYRDNDSLILTEDSPLKIPADLGYYLSTKMAGESFALSYSSQMNVSVLRYFFIYGPGQNRGMLIPRLFDSVKESRKIILSSEEGLKINPIHVVDAAAATILAGETGTSEIFNVAGPASISLRKICELFSNELGVEPIFEIGDERDSSLIASTELMSSHLIKPNIYIEESISDIRIA